MYDYGYQTTAGECTGLSKAHQLTDKQLSDIEK